MRISLVTGLALILAWNHVVPAEERPSIGEKVAAAKVNPKPGKSKRPNFVFIFCDNLGYGDTEVFNPKALQKTPRLLQMASEGMIFRHAYSAAPVCTPSRAALMTGCYPRRVGLDLAGPRDRPVLFPGSPRGLHPNEITIPEVLAPEGYRSICIGKWHLGDQASLLPTKQGLHR